MSYIKYEDGMVYSTVDKVVGVDEALSPGFYKPMFNQNREVCYETLVPKELHSPIMLKPLVDTMKYVDEFCKPETKKTINEMGYLHKMGVFLHGDSGTMKTTFSWYVASKLIETMKAIMLDTGILEAMIQSVKKIREKQDNLIVVIIDEADLYVEQEASLKKFLDGPDSLDNIIVFATTNRKEVFHPSLFRPSRFGIITEIPGIDDIKEIEKILKGKKVKYTKDELNELKGSNMEEIKDFMRNKVFNVQVSSTSVKQIGFRRSEEQEDPESISGKEIYEPTKSFVFGNFFDED